MNKPLIRTTLVGLLPFCATVQAATGPDPDIAQAEQRLAALQAQIASATEAIGQAGKGLRAQMSYAPLITWAELLSAAPPASRTIRFQQTERSGNLADRSHRCVVPFGPYRTGYWARIDEERSTRATLLLKRITAQPQADGLLFSIPMDFEARSQIAGNVRPSCSPWNAGTNIGVTGEARPETLFKLSFDGTQGGALKYSLDLVSPNRIGVEVAGHLGGIGVVRFTLPMDNVAQHLMDGQAALLFTGGGRLRMPDGRDLRYSVNTRDPTIAPSVSGVTVESDFDVVIEPVAVTAR